jgi:hypothetical protein
MVSYVLEMASAIGFYFFELTTDHGLKGDGQNAVPGYRSYCGLTGRAGSGFF